MVDITVKVLTPADDHALIALEDAKIMLGIAGSDVASDQQLQMQIEQNSLAVARLCNRVFAKEKVRETHRCVAEQYCPDGSSRIFLTHWPVKQTDIESVESPKGTLLDPMEYEIEEGSGKLTIFGGGVGEIVVTYTGGYDLPDEAPLPLQYAVVTIVRENKSAVQQAELSGIRMISHKDARVMFHSPTTSTSSSRTGTTSSGVSQAVDRLLAHFTRLEV